jgi:hypothetical protein
MNATDKAWVTRRAKAAARSAAARQANITRGAKGRSLAAKRAWKTRRANAA